VDRVIHPGHPKTARGSIQLSDLKRHDRYVESDYGQARTHYIDGYTHRFVIHRH
jgi:hypothetical protein